MTYKRNKIMRSTASPHVPYSRKVWQGESLANRLFLNLWRKKVWWINRPANKLFIVSTNLEGFSLVNHGWFAKLAKLSPRQNFPLYGILIWEVDEKQVILLERNLLFCGTNALINNYISISKVNMTFVASYTRCRQLSSIPLTTSPLYQRYCPERNCAFQLSKTHKG